jgi:CBS domain-containing protein
MGELLGMITIYDVEVRTIDRIKSWLREWIEHREVTTPALQP